MSQATTSSQRSGLVGRLVEFERREDRAALAELRRGLGHPPGTVPRMARYVEPFIPADASRWEQDVHYLVAALFAAHPDDVASEGGRLNLGWSFRRLASETGSESIEKRFLALLDAESEDLHVHLRHAVSLMRAHDVPVDYDRLLRDLRDWKKEDRRVQRRWARTYFGAKTGAEDQESTNEPATPEED